MRQSYEFRLFVRWCPHSANGPATAASFRAPVAGPLLIATGLNCWSSDDRRTGRRATFPHPSERFLTAQCALLAPIRFVTSSGATAIRTPEGSKLLAGG